MKALARIPTPILNTADFSAIFGAKSADLPLDSQGLLRAIEAVALPGTLFEILEEHDKNIVRIHTFDYPGDNLFVDRRFLDKWDFRSVNRPRQLPSKDHIIRSLLRMEGSTYIWGGNWSQGIPEMLLYYPPKSPLDDLRKKIWCLKGVDCSGFLYEATHGMTPRNTSELLFFGNPLSIEKKDPKQIAESLQPLDILVWKGHVVIVLNKDTAIESRAPFGVIKTPLVARLEEIQKDRDPMDSWDFNLAAEKQFVARRWA